MAGEVDLRHAFVRLLREKELEAARAIHSEGARLAYNRALVSVALEAQPLASAAAAARLVGVGKKIAGELAAAPSSGAGAWAPRDGCFACAAPAILVALLEHEERQSIGRFLAVSGAPVGSAGPARRANSKAAGLGPVPASREEVAALAAGRSEEALGEGPESPASRRIDDLVRLAFVKRRQRNKREAFELTEAGRAPAAGPSAAAAGAAGPARDVIVLDSDDEEGEGWRGGGGGSSGAPRRPRARPALGGRGAGGSALRRGSRTAGGGGKAAAEAEAGAGPVERGAGTEKRRRGSFAAARLPWRVVKRARGPDKLGAALAAAAEAEEEAERGPPPAGPARCAPRLPCPPATRAPFELSWRQGLYGGGAAVVRGPAAAGGTVAVVVDTREGGGSAGRLEATLAALREAGVPPGALLVRELPTGLGDYALLLLLPPGPDDDAQERLLPFAVERKRADDFALSMVDGRLARQRAAMLRLRAERGVRPVLVLEGTPPPTPSPGPSRPATLPPARLGAAGFRAIRAGGFAEAMRAVANLRLEAADALLAGSLAPLPSSPFPHPGPGPGPGPGPSPNPPAS
eukprot:tig00000769_g4030.t1